MVDPKKEKGNEETQENDSDIAEDGEVDSDQQDQDRTAREENLKDYRDVLAQMREELGEITESEKEDYGGYTYDADEKIDEEERVIQYNSLSEEVDRRKLKENMAKAHLYLEKLNIKELEIDAQQHIIIVPFEYEDLQFLSNIIVSTDWYIVKASIMELDDIPKDVQYQLFFELLKGNFLLNDVTFSVDLEGRSIWVEADIPTDNNFDHFKLQYLSIVYGIDYFIKNVSKEVKAPLQSTYTSDNRDDLIYI